MNNQRRVLLVDDEAPVREALARVLISENWAVFPTASGQRARQIAGEHAVDIALLDASLAEENGWNLAQELLVIQPALPIVMLTARPDESDHPVASQVDVIMQKPLELDVLLAKIAQLVPPPARSQL